MKLKQFGSILLLVAVLTTACSKKGPKYTQYIPKDAGYVLSFDVKSMMEKLQKDSLSIEAMMEAIKDSANPGKYEQALQMWTKFQNAGLDWENPVLLAVPTADISGGAIDIQMVAGLKDAQQLQKFIAGLPNSPKVQKDKDINYAIASNMVIGWNDHAVMVLASNTDLMGQVLEISPDSSIAAAPGSSSSLDKLKKYFDLKEAESLASVKEFTKMIGEKSDVSIFTNAISINGGQAATALAMMPKVKDLLEGIYSTTHLNFENGKMIIDGNTFLGDKLSDFLKKYSGPEIDRSMIEAFPGVPMGISAFSFKPELIPGFLAETGLDALANLALAQQGITAEEISKCFAGDFAVIFGDFKMISSQQKNYDGEMYKSTIPQAKLIVAIKLADKTAVEKLLGLVVKSGMVSRKGNRLVVADSLAAGESGHIAMGIENNMLILSNDEATYNAYAANKSKAVLSESANAAIKGKSVGFWLDGEKLLAGIPESVFDSTEVHDKNILVKARGTFKAVWFNTGNFDGGKINGRGELDMDPGKNALPQLVRFLKYVAEETSLKNAETKRQMSSMFTMPDEEHSEN